MVGQPVNRRAVLHKNVAGEVLRHGVKARTDGNALRLGKLCRPAAQHKGQHDVDDVRPLDCLPDDGIVRLCQLNAVAFYVTVENTQIPCGHHGIAGDTLLLGVGAKDRNGMPLALQGPDQVHSRQRSAVVFLAQHIADNGDVHMQSSFFFLFQWIIMRRKAKHYINNHLRRIISGFTDFRKEPLYFWENL